MDRRSVVRGRQIEFILEAWPFKATLLSILEINHSLNLAKQSLVRA